MWRGRFWATTTNRAPSGKRSWIVTLEGNRAKLVNDETSLKWGQDQCFRGTGPGPLHVWYLISVRSQCASGADSGPDAHGAALGPRDGHGQERNLPLAELRYPRVPVVERDGAAP